MIPLCRNLTHSVIRSKMNSKVEICTAFKIFDSHQCLNIFGDCVPAEQYSYFKLQGIFYVNIYVML